MITEKRKRKVSKHGVVTTLGFPEGQIVTVARVDERTEIVSLESPERVEEMVALLTRPKTERHRELMERIQGQSHANTGSLPRSYNGVEPDVALSETQASLFTHRERNRRLL
jgi:hypothetical protein